MPNLTANDPLVAGKRWAHSRRDWGLRPRSRSYQPSCRRLSGSPIPIGKENSSLAVMYKGGVDSYLQNLDAQRSLYSAQQQEIATRLTMVGNRITLYRTLGGDQASVAATP